MNDINAACAAAAVPDTTHRMSTLLPSVEVRLQTLTDLRAKRLIDTAEYNRRRAN